MLLQFMFSVILDGQDMLLNNFVLVLNSFKISSIYYQESPFKHVYVKYFFLCESPNKFSLAGLIYLVR